jgi:hypothetical protein
MCAMIATSNEGTIPFNTSLEAILENAVFRHPAVCQENIVSVSLLIRLHPVFIAMLIFKVPSTRDFMMCARFAKSLIRHLAVPW